MITICELTEGWRFNNPRVIEGNWSVGFNIKNKIPETKPIVYSLNKSYEYKEIKFTVDEIRIYPTVTEVVYHQDIPNQIEFNSVYLKDNTGRKYKLIKSHYENDRIILSFQSNYFIKASSLSLIIEGMTVFYPYDGENNYMTFDLDNKKITNINGLNLEYIRDEKTDDSINPPSIFIYFNSNMPKKDNLLYMTAEVYDESNNKYQGGTVSSKKENGSLEAGLIVYNIKTRPHFIKVKLYGYTRSYDKNLNLKIK